MSLVSGFFKLIFKIKIICIFFLFSFLATRSCMEQPTVSLWQTFNERELAHKSSTWTEVKSVWMKTTIQGCLCFNIMWSSSMPQLFYQILKQDSCRHRLFPQAIRFTSQDSNFWMKRNNKQFCNYRLLVVFYINVRTGNVLWSVRDL